MLATLSMTCAGDPATSTPSPTGLSTSEPAATRACRPIVMLPARRPQRLLVGRPARQFERRRVAAVMRGAYREACLGATPCKFH